MAFKSLAQRERMKELVANGTITQRDFDRHESETDFSNLPERLHPKKEDDEKPKKDEKPMKESER